ncbi:MAG: DUF1538 domain-containing protein [Oscillospiraceae bacterium]|nr:DUF1538 domain-containing protein [Oscillospiraceae bacterium]
MILKNLRKKLSDSVIAVAPITVFVLVLGFIVIPKSADTILMFLIGAGFVVVGLMLFSAGAELSMIPMGESLGSSIQKKNKAFMLMMAFICGFVITIAEPGLIVLAEQVPDVSSDLLVFTVAAGVGLFLAVGFIRTIYKIPLKYIFLVFYTLLFIIALFVPQNFLPIAFDSGGATTGSMTVPFIMALGASIAVKSNQSDESDVFGLVAISSIGPILAVMLLGLIFAPEKSGEFSLTQIPLFTSHDMLFREFLLEIPYYIRDISLSLSPILVLYALTKVLVLKSKILDKHTWKTNKKSITHLVLGVILTFSGLVLFLAGANVGFLFMGKLLGENLAGLEYNWLLVPVGMVLGFFLISAEPAVSVLNTQVAAATNGAISKRTMKMSLSFGVAAAVGLSMLRVLTGISILWVILPGYVTAVVLSFIVPKKFTAIAFDAGGVASGPLTSAFLLPLAIGASVALESNVSADAFGLIALVAMTPLITVQIIGLKFYKQK